MQLDAIEARLQRVLGRAPELLDDAGNLLGLERSRCHDALAALEREHLTLVADRGGRHASVPRDVHRGAVGG